MKKRNILFGLMALFTTLSIPTCKANAEPQYDYKVTDEEFGADGSDDEVDTYELQSALSMAKGSDRMITIYVPAGTYYVDKSLRVFSNTHIILDDNATIARKDEGVNTNLLHNADQDGKMDVTGGYDMSHDVIIEGGTWDGGDLSDVYESSDVIRFDHARNITIKNCHMKNTYDCHILEFIAVKDGSVTGCTFEGYRYRKGKETDYNFAREAFQIEAAWTTDESNLNNMKPRWAQSTKIDGTACQNVTVAYNTFINMPCGVGQHHYSKTGKARCKNIVISNNTITCAQTMKYCKTAVSCTGIDGLQVTNNKITGPYRFAIHEIQSTGVTINNNEINQTGITAIMVESGTLFSISGNTLNHSSKHAMSIAGGNVAKIEKNIILSPGRNGINVTGGTVKQISGNIVKGTGANGIAAAKVSGSKGGTIKSISNNQISKTNGTGITVDQGKVTKITGNVIKDSGRHGMCILGGYVGSGKKKSVGIMNNIINKCKQNGITVSGKGKISCISANKISNIKRNGISLTANAKVYWITKNTVKKCGGHGIWNGISGVKLSGNKGQIK